MTDQTSHDAVLGAARELFERKGFASTSVREICEDAGVTPPVVYYHFGSKEGLFEAVVEEAVHLDDFSRQLREAIEGLDDPWEKLRAYVHTYLAGFPQGLLNPGLHFQSSTELNERSLRQMGMGIAEIHHMTQGLLEEGIAAGRFRAMDVGLAASCLLGLVDSFVRARVYLGVAYDMDQVEACILDMVSHGIAARSDD
jgi:AcrR family transcriptional regulator